MDCQQLIDERTIKADHNPSADIDHRHAHLTTASDHVAGRRLIARDVHIVKFDALRTEVGFCT